MPSTSTLTEPRLLGTWQSDRRRTLRHWKPLSTCPPASHRKFRALFGKLVIHWTPKRYRMERDDFRRSGAYTVIARDAGSVVIEVEGWFDERELVQIHFEDDRYWVALQWPFIEWFRRVPPRPVSPRRPVNG